MGASSVIEFPKGEVVINAGDNDPRVFFVQSGSLELLVGDGVVASLGKGDFIGLSAALDGQAGTVTVRAADHCELLAFSRSDFESLIHTHPELACAMLARQEARLGEGGAHCNARMSHRQIRAHCQLDQAMADLLQKSMEELSLSARAYDRVLKVARTIADLEESERIEEDHLYEAIQYRSLDRNLFY